MAAPLLSVIVPTMNSAGVLPAALRSLASQSFRDFEVIISDGASTDQTLQVAQEMAENLPSLRIDSRPDAGIYDAINRGVHLASGHWFLVLGSDDCLHAASTLAAVAGTLQTEREASMVYGDVRMMAENLCRVPPGGRYAGEVSLNRLFSTNICQQAIFYRRELFFMLGGFDRSYKVFADWYFNLRAAFRAPARWVDVVVSDYASTGLSAQATDPAFLEHLPDLIRRELREHAHRCHVWPAQRYLLREADRLRRQGQWRAAGASLRQYGQLLLRRLPVLIEGQR